MDVGALSAIRAHESDTKFWQSIHAQLASERNAAVNCNRGTRHCKGLRFFASIGTQRMGWWIDCRRASFAGSANMLSARHRAVSGLEIVLAVRA